MPIIKVQNGYIYKKRKKSAGMSRPVFFILLFFSAVGLVCLMLFGFSKINVTAMLNLNKYKVFDAVQYYAVSVNSSNNFSDASQTADVLKLQDGAGYVLKSGNRYFLIAGIYKTASDAKSVAQRLEYDCEVVNINLDRLIVSANYTPQQIAGLRYALDLVNRTFDRLYEICTLVDRSEILDAEARQKLQVFRETCQADKETFAKLFENNFETLITRVKIFQSEVISNLSALTINNNLSSSIKYIMASALDSFCTLQREVTK